MKPLDHEDALGLRFDSDAGDNGTIRQYLYALLSTLWEEEEGFSGKRPFGNSGWAYDMYKPLIKAEYMDGKLDSNGYIEKCDKKKGKAIVHELIHFALYGYAPPKA